MKVIKEDLNIMILKDRNIIVFIIAIIFLFTGLAIFFKADFINSQVPTWLAITFIFSGAFVLLVAPITTIKLDKRSNTFFFSQKGIILNNTIKEYKLDTIRAVTMSTSNSSMNGDKSISYHLGFLLTNNDNVPLDPGSSTSSINFFGKEIPEKTLGKKISRFLNVPFQEIQLPTITSAMSTIANAIQTGDMKKVEELKKNTPLVEPLKNGVS